VPPIRKSTPSYIPHKQSGRARAVWRDVSGTQRQKLLPGEFDSEESRSAFHALGLELAAAPHGIHESETSVSELMLAFMKFARTHYVRPDGSNTHEVAEYHGVAKLVDELYGGLLAAEFGPLAFRAVRQAMIERGWCRSLVNQRANRVRRVFKWAVGEQLIPPSTLAALAAVAGLQRGRSKVRESSPVLPVDDETVDRTLPFLPRHVRGLVQFQRLTGCRPGEACTIRRSDIDTGGKVWLYRPRQHKGAWRGKPRVIAVGPRAQELLREFFTPHLEDFLFSPRRNVAEFHAGRTAERKTPLYPSHAERNQRLREKTPQLVPAEAYDVTRYGHAIKRACDRAFPPPARLVRLEITTKDGKRLESRKDWWKRLTLEERAAIKEWQRDHHWHPNQLRHTHGTKVRKEFGLEHAGAALGHSKMSATEVYAERDAGLAVEVARRSAERSQTWN
jgi:integrase